VTPKDFDILLAILKLHVQGLSKRFKEASKKNLQFNRSKASTKLVVALVRDLLAYSIFELFNNILIWLKPKL
jgi:hypothetical protein